MRFFENWGGFIWEYNSFGDYIKALLGRLIGGNYRYRVLFLLGCFLFLYGQEP